MNIICGLGHIPERASRPCVLTIGVFDGVHRGHRFVLEKVVAEAAQRRVKSAVVTFSVHPSHILARAEKTPHVMSLKHKLHYIAEAGIQACYVLDFNRSLAAVSASSFVENILLKRLGMVSLYVGEDFVFGRRAEGDVDFLVREAAEKKFSLHVVKPLRLGGTIVSSTCVRQAIRSGNLKLAQKYLGRPVGLMGRVIHGEGRGRKLGFPTANISAEHEVLVPDGVYAAWALSGGRVFPAAAYLGSKRTFHKKHHHKYIEVFVLNSRRDFYDKIMEIRFVQKIRSDQTFPDTDSLIRQIRQDTEKVKNILSALPQPAAILPF